MASRPPGTQHSDAHSMILAMCMARPIGKPVMAGKAAKIAVSQARPAMTTSTPAARRAGTRSYPSGRRYSPQRLLPSLQRRHVVDRRDTIRSQRGFEDVLSISARSTAMRNPSPSSLAISRTIASVCSRCGLAPADPADPMMRGILCLRAPCSTFSGLAWWSRRGRDLTAAKIIGTDVDRSHVATNQMRLRSRPAENAGVGTPYPS